MSKRIKRIICFLSIIFILSGCSSSSEKDYPPIDFDTAYSDFKSEIDAMISDYYTYVSDYTIEIDDSSTINIYIVVDDSINSETAVDIADTFVRRFSSIAYNYDNSLTPPASDSYGTLFDRYNCLVCVSTVSNVSNSDNYLVMSGLTSSTSKIKAK